ncbi:MAG: YibE/F family protein [Candidatus Pacebacteria bacterium]|nr:YibE/F family protein [Candidatus Paceibacterota bacterium]
MFFPFISKAAGTAQDQTTQDQITIVKAKVEEVINQTVEILPGDNAATPTQTIQAEIVEGPNNGQNVVFANDYVMLKKGDIFFLSCETQPGGNETYSVSEPDRLPVLLFFSILFILLVLIFGGLQGLRGLISLSGSLLVIIFVLLPAIFHGFSPILVSIGVSSLIIILGSYVTHGFNKTTSSAVVGMIITVVITGIMAYFAVYNSHLTGVTSDESAFLNFDLQGHIDMVGILMGGIMIGLLGVLYDVSIGQAISVEELHKIAPHINRWEIYKRSIRIGREHIGALVNTLAIAYVGASLPLLLLFYYSADSSLAMIVNREVFATEIIRILIGSIGLVLSVPITTFLSVLMLMPKNKKFFPGEELEEEKNKLAHFEHHH